MRVLVHVLDRLVVDMRVCVGVARVRVLVLVLHVLVVVFSVRVRVRHVAVLVLVGVRVGGHMENLSAFWERQDGCPIRRRYLHSNAAANCLRKRRKLAGDRRVHFQM